MKTKRALPKRFSGTICVSGILIGLVAVLLSAASIAMAAPFAYVSSFSQDRVTVVDGANGGVVTITSTGTGGRIGPMPYGVAVNRAGTRAYVANFGSGTVSVIDTATNTVIGDPLTVCDLPGCMPTGVAVNDAGTRVYVANGDGTIAVIDGTSNSVLTRRLTQTGALAGIVVVGSKLFVADFGTGSVLAVDVNTGAFTSTRPNGNVFAPVFGIAASPSGSRVYVPYGKLNGNQEFNLEVAVIDPNGPTIIDSVSLGERDAQTGESLWNSGNSPAGIAVSPLGDRVYVAVSAENTLEVIDTASRMVTRVPVGASPFGVAIDRSGAKLFVVNSGSGWMSMIDTATNTVTGPSVAVGSSPVVFGAFVGTPPFTLTTGVSPSGAGTIAPATGQYEAGSTVSVTATANTGYEFTGWSGACSGTGSCNVTMTSDKAVTANFKLLQYTLTTGPSPSGAGAVTPATGKFDYGTQLNVTATANTGYQFTGWSGSAGCTGTGPCSVTITSDQSVTANFKLVQYTLTTGTSPSVAGTITPASGGKYDHNSRVTVTAGANPGYQFTGWTGACNGTGPCTVTMIADQSVTANFTLLQYTLTTGANPNAAGTVTPASGNKYNYGTTVTVATTTNPGYQFTGWSGSGGCTGTSPCSVQMTSDKSATANFTPLQYTLTTAVSPSGAGTIAPATGKYNHGTQVSVTATAATGYQFTGWSDACTGTGACSVTMTGDRSVTATFTPVVAQQFTLTLTQDGTGTGTVGALPSSSNGTYNAGTDVSVMATPGTNCKFAGWSGACTGTGPCKVKMDASKKVIASFALTAPSCDEKIADLQKKVAADKHWKYGHGIREALRLYAAAQQELAKARTKVPANDKKYLSAVKEFENGKAAFCAGRYWRAAHEFWEAYQIAHKILEHYRR
jgi:uncharacterized repeat protein (TIGR02543 family)